MSDALAIVRSLSQEERLDAMQNARNAIRLSYGPQPKREQFATAHAERFPRTVRNAIFALCILVLVAAFSISAMRLYFIGSRTFGESIPDAVQMQIAGIATVILAEAAMLVSTLALAAFGDTKIARYILYATALAATVVALIGNAQVAFSSSYEQVQDAVTGSIVWVQSDEPRAITPFAFLEAVVPPLLVLGIAHILKMQWMSSIEMHHAVNQAYADAVNTWNLNVNADATEHPSWRQVYANALRDSLRKANARSSAARAAFADMHSADWRMLINRELASDSWYAVETPVQVQPEIQVEKVPSEQMQLGSASAPPRVRRALPVAASRPAPKHASSGTGNSTDEVLNALQNASKDADGNVQVHCPYCKREFVKANADSARLALTAHLRRCTERTVKPAENALLNGE